MHQTMCKHLLLFFGCPQKRQVYPLRSTLGFLLQPAIASASLFLRRHSVVREVETTVTVEATDWGVSRNGGGSGDCDKEEVDGCEVAMIVVAVVVVGEMARAPLTCA